MMVHLSLESQKTYTLLSEMLVTIPHVPNLLVNGDIVCVEMRFATQGTKWVQHRGDADADAWPEGKSLSNASTAFTPTATQV